MKNTPDWLRGAANQGSGILLQGYTYGTQKMKNMQ